MKKFEKLSREEMKNALGGVTQKCDPGDPSLTYQCCTTSYQYACGTNNGAPIYCTGSSTTCGCFQANCATP